MRKSPALIAVTSLLLIGAGCINNPLSTKGTPFNNAAVSAPTTPPATAPVVADTNTAPVVGMKQIMVSMRPRGGSDEVGTATIAGIDVNHTKVVIALKNAEQKSSEDAGIYAGTCKDLSAPMQYDLSAVVKGASSTVLNVNESMFVGGTKQSIRVFVKPLNAQSSLWTCGDIN